MITFEQKQYFQTFGFLIFPQTFSPSEMIALTDRAECIWQADLKGCSSSLPERQQINGFVEKHRELALLIEDDRIFKVAEELLGKDFVWIGSDGNRYIGDTGWHPDGSNFSYARIKFLFTSIH